VGSDNLSEAIDAGVAAVIVSASSVDPSLLSRLDENDAVDLISKVASAEDVKASAETLGCNAFFLDTDGLVNDGSIAQVEAILEAIPEKSVVIAGVHSMQNDNAEIALSKQLKELGGGNVICSILVQNAAVGDGEDLEYAEFVVSGLTKKKSSTFNMSGLTGSTNGHFGGVASSVAKSWLRQKQ